MHIDSPTFTHRRVLQPHSYSPKRRWDENVFGSERNLLMNHVENALKEHDNDGDILERFRREAEEVKEKKRRDRFPHLYQGSDGKGKTDIGRMSGVERGRNGVVNSVISVQPVQTNEFMSESFMVKQRQQTITHHPNQQQPQLNNNPNVFYPPPPFFSIAQLPSPPSPYIPQQTLLTYQRRLSQKNLQLHKKQEKIKRQKQQIKQLYQKLKEREKHDQLEMYVKEREEVRRLEEVVGGMGRDIRENMRVVEGLRGNNEYTKLGGSGYNMGNRDGSQRSIGQLIKDNNHAQRNSNNPSNNPSLLLLNPTINPTNNPQIIYSPTTKRNKSSIFSNIPLYNPYNPFNPHLTRQPSISEHLDQLKNYNKRLEYLHGANSEKLSRLGKNGGSEGR